MNKELLKNATDAIRVAIDCGVTSKDVGFDLDELWYNLADETLKAEAESVSIEDYFNEWDKAILELTDKEMELINLKESYVQLEQDIIENTDFKELYGANNQKVRDNHVKNELKDLVDKRHDLELRINYLKRRIDFIKSLMKMQGTLIDNGVLE